MITPISWVIAIIVAAPWITITVAVVTSIVAAVTVVTVAVTSIVAVVIAGGLPKLPRRAPPMA